MLDAANQFVEKVEGRIGASLADRGGLLGEASRALCLAGGAKRLRPRLVWLVGHPLGASRSSLEAVASAGELIHAATLLHDDVVDEASLRRGLATANARWGNAVAVLAGDWLLSSAFVLLEPCPRAVTSEAIEVLSEMSRAACDEIAARGSLVTLSAWREIAEGKTGALFAWCVRSAARVAGHDELGEALASFGRRLGVAFQLADDLKDLAGGAAKDRFADLKNGNPSMPILWAADRSPELRACLQQAWSAGGVPADQLATLGRRVVSLGAMDAALAALQDEVAAAVACLSPLGDAPWLAEIVDVARSFAPGDPAPEER